MALRPMAPPPETADFRNERRRIFLDMVSTRFVMGHGGEQIAAGNVPDCGVAKHGGYKTCSGGIGTRSSQGGVSRYGKQVCMTQLY